MHLTAYAPRKEVCVCVCVCVCVGDKAISLQQFQTLVSEGDFILISHALLVDSEQMMLEMVHDRVTTGVTRAVWTAAVLQCGKQMEKLPHYYFSWMVFTRKFGRGYGPVVRQTTEWMNDTSLSGTVGQGLWCVWSLCEGLMCIICYQYTMYASSSQ
jgi:hypothetical protein